MDKKFFIGFSRARSPLKIFSTLIRWAEYPKRIYNPLTWFRLYDASHCFTLYPKTDKRPFFMVNEAAGSSVRFMSQKHFLDHSLILKLYAVELPEDLYEAMKTEGEEWAGAPYALFENVGIVLVRIAHFFGFNIRNPFGQGKAALKCSEMILINTILRIPGVNEGLLRSFVRVDFRKELPKDLDTFGVRDLCLICEALNRRGFIKLAVTWN